jgi:Signal peptidase, peptidase S26
MAQKLLILLPRRNYATGDRFTNEQITQVLWYRLPLFLLAVAGFTAITPFHTIQIHGPSMLPTCAADHSDIWVIRTLAWYRYALAACRYIDRHFFRSTFPPSEIPSWFPFSLPYRAGDIVGFVVPESFRPPPLREEFMPGERISCKRIIGVPGSIVQRYGQYVHLYKDQDPKQWGILWPDHIDDRKAAKIVSEWDVAAVPTASDALAPLPRIAERTFVVPPGHGKRIETSTAAKQVHNSHGCVVVWVEADCPGLGVDSRHFGPVPVSSLRGKFVGRLWPLWYSSPSVENDALASEWVVSSKRARSQRPHPIPLDDATLRQFNVHRVWVSSPSNAPSQD